MNLESHTILLVDDNDDLREVTAELLEALGHRVLTAPRAEAALLVFERHRDDIDLLISECVFSGMSGVELVGSLRDLEPSLGALLISSHNNHQDLRQRIDRGEMAFLRKPFSIDELAEKIDHAFALGSGAPRELRRASSVRSPSPPEVESPSPPAAEAPDAGRAGTRGLLWRSVAAGSLAFALLVGVRWISTQPPSLPTEVPETVTRGMQIEVLYPQGVVSTTPQELRWRPVQRATSYQTHLLSVDDTVLWQAITSRPRILLPEDLRSRLHPQVVYIWTIDAFDDKGHRLSGSDRVRFLVGAQPAPGEAFEPPS